MSFKQFGGLSFAAKNNIVGNLYSTSGNLGISNSMGQENSKIISQSHVDLSGNSLMHIGSLYFMDGSVQSSAQQTSPTGAAIFNSGIIVYNGSSLNGGATIDTLHVTGTSQLDGAVTMGSTLGVTGLVTTNALNANGLITANAGLTSTAGATALGATTSTTLHVTGTSQLDGATTIGSGGLTSTAGTTTLGATTSTTLHVTGTSQLDGATTIGSGGLTSTAGTTTLGATTLGATTTTTLTASGLITANADLQVGSVVITSSSTGFYVSPIREDTATNTLYYDNGTKEIVYYPTSSGPVGTATNIAGGSANQIPYQSAPNSTIFSASLTFNGSTLLAPTFESSSDYRIKEDVTILDDSFNVNKLRPVTYTNKNTEKRDIGFIAHEVQQEFPYLVSGEKDGEQMQSLNYIGLIGVLVKEIQELKKRVQILENK